MISTMRRRGPVLLLVAGVVMISAAVVAIAVAPPAFLGPSSTPSSTPAPRPVPRHVAPVNAVPPSSSAGFEWTNLTGSTVGTPTCRDSEGLVFDSALSEVLLFGGVSQCGSPNAYSLGDTWAFSNGTWTNLSASLASAPSPRWGMAMVYDPSDQEIVLFGGTTAAGVVNNQTWVFNGTWSNVTAAQTVSPPALYGAGATYDPNLGAVLLYGGQNGFSGGPEILYNTTWEFKNGQWSSLPATGPDPLRSPSLVFDPALNASLLFGGFDGTTGGASNATWEFAGGAWSQLSPSTSPSPRFATGATYDPIADGVVLFGGTTYQVGANNGALAETWVFANQTWTNLTAASALTPSPRVAPRLVWDAAEGYGLLFGGQSNGVRYNDTWAFAGEILGGQARAGAESQGTAARPVLATSGGTTDLAVASVLAVGSSSSCLGAMRATEARRRATGAR